MGAGLYLGTQERNFEEERLLIDEEDMVDEIKDFVNNYANNNATKKECIALKNKLLNINIKGKDLFHWNQIRILITHKLCHERNQNGCVPYCAPEKTKRFMNTGSPQIVFPTYNLFLFELTYLILFFASSVLQIVRAMQDGELSFYSHLLLLLGSASAAIYFLYTNNVVLLLPHVGNIIYCIFMIVGIINNTGISFP